MGTGGTVLLQLLAESPWMLSATHVVYNLDLPKICKTPPMDMVKVEDVIRENELQLWLLYYNEIDDADGGFDRSQPGPTVILDTLAKIQVRAEGERRRGRSHQNYDQILVTDQLNLPNVENVRRVVISKMPLYVFSEPLLDAMSRFFFSQPSVFQDDMHNGIIQGMLDFFQEDVQDPTPLPVMARLALGRTPQVRSDQAEKNRRRLTNMENAILAIAPPSRPSMEALPPVGLGARPGGVQLVSALKDAQGKSTKDKTSRKGSIGISVEDKKDEEDDEEEDDNFFDEKKDYKSMWKSLADLREIPP
ncbi:unnamed protein product, partial [Polarella glacialis]